MADRSINAITIDEASDLAEYLDWEGQQGLFSGDHFNQVICAMQFRGNNLVADLCIGYTHWDCPSLAEVNPVRQVGRFLRERKARE